MLQNIINNPTKLSILARKQKPLNKEQIDELNTPKSYKTSNCVIFFNILASVFAPLNFLPLENPVGQLSTVLLNRKFVIVII